MNGDMLQTVSPVTVTAATSPSGPARNESARPQPAGDDKAKVVFDSAVALLDPNTDETAATGSAPQPGAKPIEDRPRKQEQTPARSAPETRMEVAVQDDGTVLVKVRDVKTDKVVREVPPEDLVEFGKKMRQYLGLLLDKRA